MDNMKAISRMSEREEVRIEHDIIDLDDLTCHPHNPRLIRKKKFSDLQKSLREDMWMMSVNQIIIDESNVILSGNQRVRALRKMGITNAPVMRLIGASEEQKKRLLYKINDHHGEYDPDMVANDYDVVDMDNLKHYGNELEKMNSTLMEQNIRIVLEYSEEKHDEVISKLEESEESYSDQVYHLITNRTSTT